MNKAFIAVVLRSPRVIVGYVVETYPDGRAVREHAGDIVGEFATLADAQTALSDAILSAVMPRELKH